jgi:hypothetical protein
MISGKFRDRSILAPFLLSACAFLFFLFTLAPTVLWGDDAEFQRSAYDGSLSPDGGGHWLWLQAARLFAQFPVGDVAYRANLLSAVAAAVTVFLVYQTAKTLGCSPWAAAAAGASLGVSHTFWTHAVRAEVYTLFTALLALELWLCVQWRPDRPWPLRTAVTLFGIALLGHQMALLLLPALAYLLWVRRAWLSRKDVALLVGLGLIGLVPFLVVIQRQIGAASLTGSLALYFTHAGVDFSHSFFDFSLQNLPHDLLLWIGYLGLQFAGPAGLLGLWAVAGAKGSNTANPQAWGAIAIFYVTGAAFAFSYRVNDQYVFYLPSYLAFALAVGLGWDLAGRAWRRLDGLAARTSLFLALLVLPPLLYYGMAAAFAARAVNPLGIRQLPGREPNRYFIWPAKNGYTGAAEYGREALEPLPGGSYLIADHTPYQTLLYLQGVEGLRKDVHLVKIEPGEDLSPLIHSFPTGSPVFIADDDPRYYNLGHLFGAELKPVGAVYQVIF